MRKFPVFPKTRDKKTAQGRFEPCAAETLSRENSTNFEADLIAWS
jgi:hypothetical protein